MSVQELQSQRTIRIGTRPAVRVGLGLVVALALWLGSYALGLFPWLGYGLRTFVFVKGQTIIVSYDADIRRGCLWMHVWQIFHHGKDRHVSQCVTESGRGEWTVPVKQTGAYRIFIDSSPTKGNRPSWDMTYSVWWGARW